MGRNKYITTLFFLILSSCSQKSEIERMEDYFWKNEKEFSKLSSNVIEFTNSLRQIKYPLIINMDTLHNTDLSAEMEQLGVSQIRIEQYISGSRKYNFWVKEFNTDKFEIRVLCFDSIIEREKLIQVGDYTRKRLNNNWYIEEELGL